MSLEGLVERARDQLTAGHSEMDQEQAWVQASQRGDHLAFNRLVLRWEQTVYNLTLRVLQDREEAAETTQEVFLAAFRSIGRFKGNSKFSTWIYRIAVNHSLTRLRRRPPCTSSLEDETSAGWSGRLRAAGDPEDSLLESERRTMVRSALRALSEEQRIIVELKFFQELTFEEISSLLDLADSTVKSRYYAALELLRDRLGHLSEESSEELNV